MKDEKSSNDKLGSRHMLTGKDTGKKDTGLEAVGCDWLPVEFIELIHPRGNF